ncbi:MAG: tRNA (adenosine(37)-N6)-dimethylallyltransferase MiaA [Firmicutes bacterium]|nr:tRNA (adenosine(37)-N6)-dimethylallyltransferase MiaA [Bacillota bacterium]
MTRVLVIVGPTAVGKTEVAIGVARRLGGEIISCDSMQLYRYMDIGSAKPSAAELAQVPHHMIGVIDPRDRFSAARYRELAEVAVADIVSRGKLPVICGGTGLYLDALLYGLDFAVAPESDPAYRESLYAFAEEQGAGALYARLSALDPAAAARIHPHNVKRVIRALEAAERERPLADFAGVREKKPVYDAILVGLSREREELYDRINRRVDLLLAAGLFEEVQALMAMGLDESDISMKGIGYKEVIACLKGEYGPERAAELIKRNTRHYAKRQMTWFKRYADMKWFDLTGRNDLDRVAEEIAAWLPNA